MWKLVLSNTLHAQAKYLVCFARPTQGLVQNHFFRDLQSLAQRGNLDLPKKGRKRVTDPQGMLELCMTSLAPYHHLQTSAFNR